LSLYDRLRDKQRSTGRQVPVVQPVRGQTVAKTVARLDAQPDATRVKSNGRGTPCRQPRTAEQEGAVRTAPSRTAFRGG